MDHIASVRAALKALAPVVAIPVEGRAPICVKAKLLKGALKGVTVHSVTVLANGCLKITGMAGMVRTSCTLVPIERWKALIAIREWTIKEREKRIRVINQGVLSAEAQRAMKKTKIEAEAGNALKDAQKGLESIYRSVKEHVNPELTYFGGSVRDGILAKYSAFRAARPLRKKGSVIRWKLKQCKAELEKITVKKGTKRGPKKTYARTIKDVPRVLVLTQMINSLYKQFESLFPPVLGPYKWWTESWIEKRPKEQTTFTSGSWRYSEESYNRKELAQELREARGTIRALTPPEDETEQIAAQVLWRNRMKQKQKHIEERLIPLGFCMLVSGILCLFLCRILAEIPWVAKLLRLDQGWPLLIQIVLAVIVCGAFSLLGGIALAAARDAFE